MKTHQLNSAVETGLPLDFQGLMFKYTLEAFVKYAQLIFSDVGVAGEFTFGAE